MANRAWITFIGNAAAENRAEPLEKAGYRCRIVDGHKSALDSIAVSIPGVAVVAAGEEEGLDLIRALKSDPETRRTPVAAVEIGDRPDALQKCFEAGADDVFEDTACARELVARMRGLIRLSCMEAALLRISDTASEFGVVIDKEGESDLHGSSTRLIVVGADDNETEALLPGLSKSGLTLVTEPDPYRARSRVEGSDDEEFDGALVYVRDEEMRETCRYFCKAIRNDRRLYDMPLFLIAAPNAFAEPADAYEEGANTVVAAPVSTGFVEAHLRMLLKGRDRRRQLGRRIRSALTENTADDLETIFSNDFTRAHLHRLSKDVADRGVPSAAILFFVPTIGEATVLYSAEEAALLRHQIADWVSGLVRVEDTVGRAGADEFLALLPETSQADADMVRRRVTGVLHHSQFRLGDNVPLAVEVYVQSGLAEILPDDSLEEVIRRASDLLE